MLRRPCDAGCRGRPHRPPPPMTSPRSWKAGWESARGPPDRWYASGGQAAGQSGHCSKRPRQDQCRVSRARRTRRTRRKKDERDDDITRQKTKTKQNKTNKTKQKQTNNHTTPTHSPNKTHTPVLPTLSSIPSPPLIVKYPPPPPPPTPTTSQSCFLLSVSQLSVHERDTCVLTEHPPWVVVFLYPWSFVASAAVDDVAGGAHLVAHMSMQQAAKLSVLLCFSFVGFFSLFQATPAGPWVIAFFVTEARRPKGDRQAPALTCSTHTHTHTHTNSFPPFSPGAWAPLGFFFQ